MITTAAKLSIFLVCFLIVSFECVSQPTIDGDLSDAQYVSIATKQNANSGFGVNIDVTEILYYSDVANSKLYLGAKGKLDTGSDNGIGIFLNFSGVAGVAASSTLGFSGAGHYMDGQGGGSNDDFKADFETDYMLAMNPGSGTASVFLDAAKIAGGNSTDFIGTSNQTGGTATDPDVFGTGATATFAFHNGGGANQGFEIVFDYAALGINSSMTMEAFAFIVSATGFFSDVTVPGNRSTGNPGFNANFNQYLGKPYHSTPAAPLPVNIESLWAKVRLDHTIELNWTTASEQNNNYFSVEKSKDGRAFDSIGKIEGAGNFNEKKNYQFVDVSPYSGINYYRLKQVDYDGQFSYSELVSVRYINNITIQVYPNPVTNILNISMSVNPASPVSAQLFDASGKLIINKQFTEGNTLELDMNSFTMGIYLLQISDTENHILAKQRIIK